ncbi:MAG: hypothetical protein ABJF88_04645 [Rhodothermales bacterium]
MRLVLLTLFLASAPIAGAQDAAGGERLELVFRTEKPPEHARAPASPHAQRRSPPLAVVFLGAAAGYGLGSAGGYGIGLAADRSFIAEDILSEYGLVGAWIGSSTASALGAHLANGRRGTLWLNVLVTTAAQGLYVYAVAQTPAADYLLLGTPLVGVATSVTVERLSSP